MGNIWLYKNKMCGIFVHENVQWLLIAYQITFKLSNQGFL